MTGYPWGVDYQLGILSYIPDQPSKEQGCYVGTIRNQGYGSHTYSATASPDEDRGYSQAFLDQKSLNCVTFPMMAAFCAWDGGWVPTWEDEKAARPTTKYPWGNLPEAGGYNTIAGTTTFGIVGPANTNGFVPLACPQCNPTLINWNHDYDAGENASKPWDTAYSIAPPGRFPYDKGPFGHFDVMANVIELTSSVLGTRVTTDFTGKMVTENMMRWSTNGSWEGHPIGTQAWSFPVLTKYGKTGGRCARATPPKSPCVLIASGAALTPGNTVTSCDKLYQLSLQKDGNLVLSRPGLGAVWATQTVGTTSAAMQPDGNLVLHGSTPATYSTKTFGNPGANLVIQDNGNLVVTSKTGAPLWQAQSFCGAFAGGRTLTPGQNAWSCDGRFRFTLQADGNLVLWNGINVLWASKTLGVTSATFQGDGNLVLHKGTTIPFASNTGGNAAGSILRIQNDGNVVIYSAANKVLWATQTGGH